MPVYPGALRGLCELRERTLLFEVTPHTGTAEAAKFEAGAPMWVIYRKLDDNNQAVTALGFPGVEDKPVYVNATGYPVVLRTGPAVGGQLLHGGVDPGLLHSCRSPGSGGQRSGQVGVHAHVILRSTSIRRGRRISDTGTSGALSWWASTPPHPG